MEGEIPVTEFYEYHLPAKFADETNGAVVGNRSYVSVGTTDLQRPNTSIAFLYRGPDGLSLVLVHGSLRRSNGGAATFRITGLPEDGDWVVKDDYYRDPDTGERAASNYDRWRVDEPSHRIDWTWGDNATDGGVFRDLGDDFRVVVRPQFNGAASLDGVYYDGQVTEWQFLSRSTDDVRRIPLDRNKPIRLATGECMDR